MQPDNMMNTSNKSVANNVQSIQLMRGIAAVLVVLLHSSVKAQQYCSHPLAEFSIGGAGVDLFFIVSGHVMCLSTDNKPMNFFVFLFHRIRRIIPLYWLSATIALGVFIYRPDIVNTSGGETDIWASYTLLPTFDRLLNSNGWTLSYEFFFYLIFGFFIHKGTNKTIGISSIILLLLVVAGWLFPSERLALYFTTHPLYLEFIFGMACYYFINTKQFRISVSLAITLCILGAGLLLAEYYFDFPGQDRSRSLYWGVPMLSLFTGLLGLEAPIQKGSGLLKKLLLLIGDSSYSLYLFHPFALAGTAMCLRRFNMTGNSRFFMLTLVVSAIMIGYLVYLFIERPLVAFCKKSFFRKNQHAPSL